MCWPMWSAKQEPINIVYDWGVSFTDSGGKPTGVLNFIGRVSALSVIMRKSTLFIYFDVAFREEIFHAFKQKMFGNIADLR